MQSPDSCTSLLKEMVKFDTVNSAISGKPDAERDLSLYLETQAEHMGLHMQRLPVSGEGFNLLVTHQIAENAPWILFESHLDTVSVEGMTIHPFEGQIKNGRMYGRGACDTKGTGAAMLWRSKNIEKSVAAPTTLEFYTPSMKRSPKQASDIAQAHTADEWIDLVELDQGVEVYAHLMRSPLS